MNQVFAELAKLSPGALAATSAALGAIATIIAALLTGLLAKFLVTPFLSARDKQDREVEWTKLDIERKLKSCQDFSKTPLRPCILDFLANYRDLQELGTKSPRELFITILKSRINTTPVSSSPDATQPSTEVKMKESRDIHDK